MSRNHVTPMGDPEKGIIDKSSNVPKKKIVTHDDIEKEKKFDQFYKDISKQVITEEKRIDYILVHECINLDEIEDEEDKVEEERKNQLRERFEQAMKDEWLQIQKVRIENKTYTKIHSPFKRMCEEAELVSLEMPMQGVPSEQMETSFFTKWVNKVFVTDNEVDMVSAPFKMDRMFIYQNHADPTNFFRPAIRALLVDHILVNIDLRTTGEKFVPAKQKKSVINCCGMMKDDTQELGDLQKVGLNFMIMEGVYDDKFILHEESEYDPKDKDQKPPSDPDFGRDDPRYDLQLTWIKFFKFQPLWKIRNYFGEKIGFYFAWTGTLITTLWLPMLFGFIVFLYGLIISYSDADDSTSTSDSSGPLGNVRNSFDNDTTPFFAIFLCVWGTLFLEVWKRKQATLAYEWDVEQFEENEPDRPEFYGTKRTVDPVTKEQDWYYPFTRRAWKILVSSLSLLFMICLVIVSVTAVIIYRVIATIDYCPNMSSQECLLVATVISSVMNALSIVILGKLYNIVARKLTDWENHRTNTAYNDALVIKLFGFQFVNNYSSCFYIAFVRGRLSDIGGKGSAYSDDCEGSCMSQLSFQVMILMLTKPLSKFCLDVILPYVLMFVKKKCQCMKCLPCLKNFFIINEKPESEKSLLEIEIDKPDLGNFTLEEYTEKVILYGLMMLFAASFPLAPLLALLFNLIDLRVDAKRLIWMYRRPLPIIAEDIGTWYVILELLNFGGVISHAFLIAFTSAWGSKYDTTTKLWIVIGFEHIVFLLKLLVGYFIPDVPAPVRLALRKKRHHLKLMLDKDRKAEVNGGANPRDTIELARKEQAMLNREDTRATSPWRRSRKPATIDSDDTAIRKLKKKDKPQDTLIENREDRYYQI